MEAAEVSAPAASTCWRCRGAGFRARKLSPGVVVNAACAPCGGSGSLRRAPARTAPRAEKEFPGWPPLVGPPPASALAAAAPEEEACYLVGGWRLLQRSDAHRYSTDDVVTAWAAWRAARALGLGGGPIADIGCGLGSVLLMSAWLHPGAAAVVGAEAQPSRLALARRSIACAVGGGGGGAARVAAVAGDLREAATHAALAAAAGGGAFPLITGTPPYFDVAAGGTPPHEESARCLFEYRGGVEAYCAAAAALLAPGGAFAVCESSLSLRRAYAGAAAAGLAAFTRVDVVPAHRKPPLFFVLVCGRRADAEAARRALAAPAAFASPLPLAEMPHADMRAPGGEFAAYYAALASAALEGGGSGDCGGGGSGGGGCAPPAAPAAVGPAQGRAQRARPPPHAALLGVPLDGEPVTVVRVRGAAGGRTPQYRMLLAELGKPSD